MVKLSFEQRLNRRERLIGLLRSEDYWTSSLLRERLGVSQRTLMRDLAELREAGYPIDSERGRGGGVRLQGRWGIDRLQLSHQEVVELVLALAVAESMGSPLLTDNLQSLRQKLFQAFPQEQRRRVSSIRKRILLGESAADHIASAYKAPGKKVSEAISEAFLQQRCLEIEYQSEAKGKTRRVIEAHYILLVWPIWYILAWDHLRDAPRVFRTDRVRTTRQSDNSFKLRPKDLYVDQYTPLMQSI